MHTCDKYSELWDSFVYYFDKHFKDNLKKYIATEEKKVNYKGWINIKTGKGEWSDRLRIALKQIPDDQIFYIQEDIWLDKDFELPKCIHVCPTNKYLKTKGGVFEKESDYLMNHKPAIWDKEFFLKYLKPNQTPWENEKKESIEIRKNNDHKNITIIEKNYYKDVCRKGNLTTDGIKLKIK